MKKNSIIYFKAPTKVCLYNQSKVLIGDLGEIHGDEMVVNKVKSLAVKKIKNQQEKEQLTVSMLDIIKRIHQDYDEVQLVSLGEQNTVVYYWPEKKEDNKVIVFLKVLVVSLTLMFGSAFALMTFHTDASVPNVFATMNEIFTGEYIERPFFIIVPYSIGLLLGVTVFFNHIGKKKLTEDPTPIQVELQKYDTDVTNCLVDVLSEKPGEGCKK